MSDRFFTAAYKHTLNLEGGFSDHPSDHGGDTVRGVSLRFLQSLPMVDGDINGDGHVTAADLHAMNPSDRIHLYKKYFWDHYGVSRISHERIAIKLYDTLVNMRSAMAVKIVQRALRACEKQVWEDGILGSQTVEAINSIVHQNNLLAAMRSEQWGIYRLIIAKDATQADFENGWKMRAYS